MADSNSGERSWGELFGFVILTFTFIFAVLGWAIPTHLSYDQDTAESVARNQILAENYIGKNCIAVPIGASTDCLYRARAQLEESKQGIGDLEAQKKMALWTAIMGAMAVIGIGLSGLGVYLIWRTWEATKRAAENSRETLNAYIWKERGHVEVVKLSFIHVSPEPLRDGVFIELKNVGLSPVEIVAINFKLVADLCWEPEGMDSTCKRVLIPAGETREGGIMIFQKLSEGCLIGSVEYKTLRNQKFRTYFCFGAKLANPDLETSKKWAFHQYFPPALPSNT